VSRRRSVAQPGVACVESPDVRTGTTRPSREDAAMCGRLVASVVVALALAVAGCSGGDDADPDVAVGATVVDPMAVVQDAIDRTVGAPSLLIGLDLTLDGSTSSVVVAYVAPDRFRVVEGSEESLGQVQIGETIYLPTADGRFNRVTAPGANPADDLFGWLQGFREGVVTQVEGDRYAVDLGEGATGTLRVVDGQVVELHLDVPSTGDLGPAVVEM
jgi:hypothetical protein